ncbi:MAG: hypothetical protein WD934_03325 [Gemmatimonadales bacterium]
MTGIGDLAEVREGRAFNLIHRNSYLQVDLFPIVSPAIRVATREDILLAKLWWYRLGDESSERHRGDIVGIIALNRELLDRAYLARWAADLGVGDLLARFLEGAER